MLIDWGKANGIKAYESVNDPKLVEDFNAMVENHKNGYKAAWVVEKYGLRLIPELYAHLNPMPYEAALQMEMDLADDLRREGYTVTGGH